MRLSYQRGDITQVYLPLKSRFCGRGMVVWFQGCRWSTGLPSGSLADERFRALPVVVVGTAQQDAHVQVDIHQTRW